MDTEFKIRNGLAPWFPSGTGLAILADFGHETESAFARHFADRIERTVNVAYGVWVHSLLGKLEVGGITPADIAAGHNARLPSVPGLNIQVTAVELGVAPSMCLSRQDGVVGCDAILELLGFTPRTVRFNIARDVLAERVDEHALAGIRLLVDLASREGLGFARQIGDGIWGSYPDVKPLDIPDVLSSHTIGRLVEANTERDGFLGFDMESDEDWADNPSPKTPDQLMRSLRDVGSAKPIGYLPIQTITKTCGMPLADAIAEAEVRGLAWRVVDAPPASHIASGALYVWDRVALQALLDANRNILEIADWPLDPDAFVEKVDHVLVHQEVFPALFELIGAAFNDDRFRDPQRTRRPATSA
ncbi:hypothetical protein FHW79_005351 [Azospirillum sp. OGB3]|uniref:hypothetical protein n=1 Tax=Azospirillum sp. OGB3 TaxID=2587012 RepID=UPI001605D5D5|nr:hypothetical protein [Azospirillum sp. OGB3]MBB3267686.1 hypothetical protein [Azospirillum sp. OGB3]